MKLALVGDIGGTNARFALWRDEQLEAVQVLADPGVQLLVVKHPLSSRSLKLKPLPQQQQARQQRTHLMSFKELIS